NDFAFWPILLEKAYAQLNESGWIGQDGTNAYEAVIGSDTKEESRNDGIVGGSSKVVLPQITNRAAGAVRPDDDEWIGKLAEQFNAGHFVLLSTKKSPSSRSLVGPHSYLVVEIETHFNEIVLWNPWNDKEDPLNPFDNQEPFVTVKRDQLNASNFTEIVWF